MDDVRRVKPKLLYVVAEDWAFCSHRLQHAEAALSAGYEVVLATRVSQHGDRIRNAGIKLIPIGLSRGGRNPWHEFSAILELAAIYRKERPDIVHHVAMKPVLYGSVAAIVARVPGVVNAVAGLGYVFVSRSLKTLPLRMMVKLAFRWLFNRSNTRVIVQNPDDLAMLTGVVRVAPDKVHLIRGSGVDLKAFPPTDIPEGKPLVVLPARMLWDKGVGEFVQSAILLQDSGVEARFALVGEADPDNPASISREQLEQWHQSGQVEWWGRQADMPAVFRMSHIVCLPSYREGVPKALLEAASSARPIVTTDAPGCREVVVDGSNGFLVRLRDPDDLGRALKRLIGDRDLCVRMGAAGRALVEKEFSVEWVSTQIIHLYQDLSDEERDHG